MEVAVLASGSSGNAVWIASGDTAVIIDAGISARRVVAAATELGLDTDRLGAVLVTHEHSDHVSGLGPLVRRFELPLYATAGTHAAIDGRLGRCHERLVVEAGETFDLNGLEVSPFAVSHDCVEPVGYTVCDGSSRAIVATDLGVVSHAVRQRLAEADCVVLEFNHDEHMLRDGGYPWFLKQRIAGREGHLSNEAAARELVALADGPMSALVLAHLSRENNEPRIAAEAASEALERAGRTDVRLYLAEQTKALGPIRFGRDTAGAEGRTTGVQASCTR